MATTLWLRDTTENGIGGGYRDIDPSGAGSVSFPGTALDVTPGSGGSADVLWGVWVTGYPTAGFTFTGDVNFTISAGESSTSTNIGIKCKVFKRDDGGVETEIADFPRAGELTTTSAERTWTGNPPDTTIGTTDRLVFKFYTYPQGGATYGSGFGRMRFNAVSGASQGESRLTIDETVVFSWSPPGPTVYEQSLSATVTLTASIRKTVLKYLSAPLTLTATLARIALRPVALVAGMTLSATMRRQINKGLSATTALTATIRKTVSKSLSDTLTLTATIAKAFPVRLVASVSLSASIAKTIAKSLAASLGLTAVLGKIKVAIVSMSATVSLTASLATIRVFYRTLSATVTLTASIRRTISKRLVALQPTLARPIAWIAYQFAAIRNDKPNWNQCPRCARKVRPNKMHQQMEFRGPRLVWTGLYVCHSCLDEPQQQGIWPRETGGDPKPVILARPRRD